MTNRSIVIFNRTLKLPELRKLKKRTKSKVFRRLDEIQREVYAAAKFILGKPLTHNSVAYEVVGPEDLFALFMINDPPVFMYKPDKVDLSLVEKFSLLHSNCSTLITHHFTSTYDCMELCATRLEELGKVPFDHSLKNVLTILKQSAEEDRKKVTEACARYFNARAPYRFDLDWNSSIQASAGEG